MADPKDEALMDAMDTFADHAAQALRDAAAGKHTDAAIAQANAQLACDRAVDILEGIVEKEADDE